MANGYFDPDDLRVMGAAYEAAMHALGNPGRHIPDDIREAVAKRILVFADDGERDPVELLNAGLDAIQLSSHRWVDWPDDLGNPYPSNPYFA